VNGDPVNWVDLWGLMANEPEHLGPVNVAEPTYFTQGQWAEVFGQNFAATACAATSLLNEVSEIYTNNTGTLLGMEGATAAMQGAVNNNDIDGNNANVNNWTAAANDMLGVLGQTGNITYNEQGQHQIYAQDPDRDGEANHFVNSSAPGQYFDTLTGNTGNIGDTPLQEGRPTRGIDYTNDN
jgi:hypothetical protein